MGALTVIVTITPNLSPSLLQLNQPFRDPCLPVPEISRKSTDKLWSYLANSQTNTNKQMPVKQNLRQISGDRILFWMLGFLDNDGY